MQRRQAVTRQEVDGDSSREVALGDFLAQLFVRAREVACVVAIHDLGLAMRYADRIVMPENMDTPDVGVAAIMDMEVKD